MPAIGICQPGPGWPTMFVAINQLSPVITGSNWIFSDRGGRSRSCGEYNSQGGGGRGQGSRERTDNEPEPGLNTDIASHKVTGAGNKMI